MHTEANEFPATECLPSAQALIGVSLCEAARTLDGWSRLLFIATVLPWLAIFPAAPPSSLLALMAASTALACIETYHALRLTFDRPVFAKWAQCSEDTLPEAMKAFDATRTRLFRKNHKSNDHGSSGHRSMADRVKATQQLFFRQAICFAAQAAALLMSLAVLGVCSHNA
ncbi:MAG: hypothetical protein LBI68_03540 [Azoarcus sp.]|jgi:hypothetical protein|nr:hypothetical protein [Azoarcus sp.]